MGALNLTWTSLGSLNLEHDNWLQFPNGFQNAELFQFRWNIDWARWTTRQGFRSYCRFKFLYPDSPAWAESPSQAIYPEQANEIRKIPPVAVDTTIHLAARQYRYRDSYGLSAADLQALLIPIALEVLIA